MVPNKINIKLPKNDSIKPISKLNLKSKHTECPLIYNNNYINNKNCINSALF